MPKILYVLQQSIFKRSSDGELTWMFADSNINMMVGIVRELTQDPEYEFAIVSGGPFENNASLRDLFSHPQVTFHELPLPVDPVQNRYEFSSFYWRSLIEQEQPDIIWNNIAELTRNFRSLLISLRLPNVKLISCCYWLDTPLLDVEDKVDPTVSYMFRQLDGALAADLAPFTCTSTHTAFFENIHGFMKEDAYARLGLINLRKKTPIWDFGFSAQELDDGLRDHIDILENGVQLFVFPNRLSGINYTHHLEAMEAANVLWKERQDFRIAFTNPSGKMPWEELRTNVPAYFPYHERSLSRLEYINLLWNADFSFALFEQERYGGCSNVESIYCGALPLMPRIHEYEKRAPQWYPLFLDGSVTVEALVCAMRIALDMQDDIRMVLQRRMAEIVKLHSSFEYVAKKVRQDISHLLSGSKTLGE